MTVRVCLGTSNNIKQYHQSLKKLSAQYPLPTLPYTHTTQILPNQNLFLPTNKNYFPNLPSTYQTHHFLTLLSFLVLELEKYYHLYVHITYSLVLPSIQNYLHLALIIYSVPIQAHMQLSWTQGHRNIMPLSLFIVLIRNDALRRTLLVCLINVKYALYIQLPQTCHDFRLVLAKYTYLKN